MCGFISLHAQKQRGKATYYSKRATGARTANGDRLHHDSLTCAHRTLPFGSLLRVTNIANGKSVTVRVNDRGPFTRGRIIDLSWGAADAIGMLARGVAMVEIEVLSKGIKVPYKPNDGLFMPFTDFQIAEEGYSYIDQWADRDNDAHINLTDKRSATPKNTQTTKGKHAAQSKVKAPAGEHKPRRTRTVADAPKTSLPAAPHTKATPKNEKTNTWKSVFDKLKNH